MATRRTTMKSRTGTKLGAVRDKGELVARVA